MSLSKYWKKVTRQISRSAKKHGKYIAGAGLLFVPGAPAFLLSGAKTLGTGALAGASYLTGPTTGIGLLTKSIGSIAQGLFGQQTTEDMGAVLRGETPFSTGGIIKTESSDIKVASGQDDPYLGELSYDQQVALQQQGQLPPGQSESMFATGDYNPPGSMGQEITPVNPLLIVGVAGASIFGLYLMFRR